MSDIGQAGKPQSGKPHTGKPMSQDELDDLVASTDTGGRNPQNKSIVTFMAAVAFAWALFQVWIASPLPFILEIGVFGSKEARPIHLGFAIFLAFLAFPFMKRSPRSYIPLPDWGIAVLATFCVMYVFLADTSWWEVIFDQRLSDRPANPNQFDIIVAAVGMVLLLEATRRALGPPLVVLAVLFLLYTFLGPYMPALLAWKGAGMGFVADKQWLSQNGVFGTPLGVSTDLIFLFVLFGALLERAGAGNYFIKVAFSLLGHYRGGPAKAAVVASGMTGLISGSSIANVVTTGTFTIPMMKRTGFSSEKAGAVEVASSVNGQIMPPVMGAAAFLIAENLNIAYFEVVKHAFVPAVISYIALVYIVHLEAMKQNLPTLERATAAKPLKIAIISSLSTVALFVAVAGGIGYVSDAFLVLKEAPAKLAAAALALALVTGVTWGMSKRADLATREKFISTGFAVLGFVVVGAFVTMYFIDTLRELDQSVLIPWYLATFYPGEEVFGVETLFTPWIVGAIILAIYVYLIRMCAAYEDLEPDDPNSDVVTLPEPKPTIMTGLHFLLPVIVLIWCLMVERLSPTLSAFWATAFMMFILLTQAWLFRLFRKQDRGGSVRTGFGDLVAGMIAGSRNMIGIAIATAAAGIIVGAVDQTGVGGKFAALVEFLSQGNIMLILLLTALLSIILGMGLPTTANYLVVSALLVQTGVIGDLARQNGLIIPEIAQHLFVFYFGLMADVTPPVGLASFAAAAVSGGDVLRTGFIAFFYSMRTALLPFLFVFNPAILLIGVGPAEAVLVFIISTLALLVFTAGSQGYFFARSRLWESAILLLVAFTLFRPGYWMDMIVAPYQYVEPTRLVEVVENAEPGEELRVEIDGLDETGEPVTFFAMLPVKEGASGEERLDNFGLLVFEENGELIVDGTNYDSEADKGGLFDFDQKIIQLGVPADQPAKEWMWIPAFVVLIGVVLLQRRRMEVVAPAAA